MTLTMITGGARSGKSAYGVALAQTLARGRPVFFVATAQPLDEEMAQRIRRHRQLRPPEWVTIEEPLHPAQAIESRVPSGAVVVLDCLTTWLGNLFHHQLGETGPHSSRQAEELRRLALAETDALCRLPYSRALDLVVITNEVGLGLVPESPLARLYRDLLGEVNQVLARQADRLVLMVAGIPLAVKNNP